MSNFQAIESLFSNFLSEEECSFSESELAEVRKFIDVGEYGLALETLVDIHLEENKVATASARDLVSRLAVAMSMDPEPLLQQLPQDK